MNKPMKPFQTEIKTLGFYINRLLYTMQKKYIQTFQELGLDLQMSEFIVIRVLGEEKEVTQSQLAIDMGMERSGISRTLAALEEKGYIEKKPLNKKTNLVYLTEKGKDILPICINVSDLTTDEAFGGFSQKRREATLKNLDKIFRNLKLEDQ